MLQAPLGALRHMSSWEQCHQSVAERLCPLLRKAHQSHQIVRLSIAQIPTDRMADCMPRTAQEEGIKDALCLFKKSPACSAGLLTSGITCVKRLASQSFEGAQATMSAAVLASCLTASSAVAATDACT